MPDQIKCNHTQRRTGALRSDHTAATSNPLGRIAHQIRAEVNSQPPPAPARQLLKNGAWNVPPEQRPAGWQSMTTYREMEPHQMNYNKGNASRSHGAQVVRPETVTPEWILEVFRGPTCECGRRKDAKTAFCKTCYGRLNSAERRALWHTFGNGFEQAYEAAAAELAEYWQQIKAQAAS